MKNFKFNKVSIIVLAVVFTLSVVGIVKALAPATSPDLGAADSFSVIGATGITGTVPTSGITGNVGNPAGGQITNLTAVMVGGTIQSFDQVAPGTTLMNPNVMTDLTAAYGLLDAGNNASGNCIKASTGLTGTDSGVTELGGKSLAPGVYCTSGSFGITTGAGPLTLQGTTGTWVFKAAEGITTGVGSSVTGGDPCNVWWRFGTAAAGLGDNSTFIGTIIAHTGITFGTGVTLNGRALAEGANVTLNSGGTISGPTCSAPTLQGTLHVTKTVVNTGGGTKVPSDFTMLIDASNPAQDTSFLGDAGHSTTLDVGAYSVTETGPTGYTSSMSDGCSGTIEDGVPSDCTITNTYIIPVSHSSGGGGITYGCKDEKATNYNAFSSSNPALCVYANIPVVTPVVIIPKLPKTGFPSQTWYGSLLDSFLNLFR